MKRSTFELGLISPSYLIPTQWLAGSNSFFFIPGWAKKVLRIMPVVMITHKYYQDEVFYYFLLQLLSSKLCSNTQGKSVAWRLGRVYSRARHCRISAIWEKCHIKFTLSRQMGRKKIEPRINAIFWNKVFENITDNNIDLSQLPFSSSFESLFRQTNIRDSAVIRTQAFSVAQNVPKWRQSFNKRSFPHGTVCTNKFKYLLGDPLSWKRAL